MATRSIGQGRDLGLPGGVHDAAWSRCASVAASITFSVPGDGDGLERDVGAGQPRRFRLDVAVLEPDLGAQLLERQEVQVDRPHADGAPAGQRHAHRSRARQERPQDENRRPHRLDELVRERPRTRWTAPRSWPPPGPPRCARRCAASRLAHRPDVGDVGQVRQAHRLGRQEGRREAGQRGVLRARDGDLAGSREGLDEELIHGGESPVDLRTCPRLADSTDPFGRRTRAARRRCAGCLRGPARRGRDARPGGPGSPSARPRPGRTRSRRPARRPARGCAGTVASSWRIATMPSSPAKRARRGIVVAHRRREVGRLADGEVGRVGEDEVETRPARAPRASPRRAGDSRGRTPWRSAFWRASASASIEMSRATARGLGPLEEVRDRDDAAAGARRRGRGARLAASLSACSTRISVSGRGTRARPSTRKGRP